MNYALVCWSMTTFVDDLWCGGPVSQVTCFSTCASTDLIRSSQHVEHLSCGSADPNNYLSNCLDPTSS